MKEVFYEKGVLKNFAKFIGKYLCQSLFFIKVALSACNFIKKATLTQVFSCEFWKIFKDFFFTEHLETASNFTSNLTNKKLVIWQDFF